MQRSAQDDPEIERPRLLVLLGLADGSDDDPCAYDAQSALRMLEANWPVALVAQTIALAVGLFAIVIGHRADLLLSAIVVAVVTVLAGAAVPVLMRTAQRRDLAGPVRVRLLLAPACLSVAALLWLAHLTGDPGATQWQFAGFVAAFGAIAVTAAALYVVRAAILAFAVGVAVVTFVLAGLAAPSAAALAMVALLTLSARRLALGDRERDRAHLAQENDGKLASRLVEEFERHGSGWFWQTDRQGRLTYLSEKVAHELRLDGAEPIGAQLTQMFQLDHSTATTARTLGFHLTSRTSFSDYPVQSSASATTDRWWSISGRAVTDDRGAFHGFIGNGSDLTEKRRSEAEITRLALFDGLTGLANRQRMKASLDQTLAHRGHGFQPTALMLLDLDRFKAVNDTLGHQTGDALLQQVAQRLLRSVGEAGLVGRLGGDEFQVVLPRENDPERLAELARTIIASLSQPYSIEGAGIAIGCSIGIAVSPDDGDTSEALVRNADLALYAAKADGRGIHRFFKPELLAGAQNRKQLEDDLRHALAQDQFHIAYQPVVSTKSEQIVGYEALLRWDHPTRGAISPAEFIPVAEDSGLIEAIGEWVMRTACHEAANWPEHVRVAVNVSPIQFANPALPAIVTSALARSGIAPARLELEITESVFVDETASSDFMFKKLKGLGVRLALDDFGTGYSSLGYLKKAPFDKIKIDQSFVRGAAIAGNRNAAIIKAIVTLADTLGMETTAEGVEVRDEIDLIRELGCSHIQGYIYGRPARAEDVRKQLVEQGGRATASGFRVSRSPRTKMLRSANIAIGGNSGEVRIRDISSTGAMIDGIEINGEAVGVDVMIELLENEMFPAKLRWANEGRAGLEFAESFNLERLNAPPASTLRRAS